MRRDIIFLSADDIIPSDVRILSATVLFISQAALTDESPSIEKAPSAIAQMIRTHSRISLILHLWGTRSGAAPGFLPAGEPIIEIVVHIAVRLEMAYACLIATEDLIDIKMLKVDRS
ncbi:hypothetical protein [Herminiimonas aquatilis]|uniref:Uncharacterized protein n=1 Tax=Herminiimonas aquatilis TaxID=345342 RepID=A0ABW2J895_9BURK